MTPAREPRVYVASPLGFTLPTQAFNTDVLLPKIVAAGLVALDPWAAPFDDMSVAARLPYGEARKSSLHAANDKHGAYNAELIREADALLAVLDGSDVDSGTASEIGYAAALGKPVVGWRSDLRVTGDNDGGTVNLQVEYFATLHSGRLYTDLDAAISALGALATAHTHADEAPR